MARTTASPSAVERRASPESLIPPPPPSGGDLAAFVQVLQLPHVLPIQGPYAIKLLKALAEDPQNKLYGSEDSLSNITTDAMRNAVSQIFNSYSSFIDKLVNSPTFESSLSSGDLSTHIEPHIHKIAQLYAQILVDGTDQSTTIDTAVDEIALLCVPSSTPDSTFDQQLREAYKTAISAYLKNIFSIPTELTLESLVLHAPSKAPLPIENVLILAERELKSCMIENNMGDVAICFLNEVDARAAYDRAVAVGCALRRVLNRVWNTNFVFNDSTHHFDTVITRASATAVSLISCAALRCNDDPLDFKWNHLSDFNFSDELRYYTHIWQTNFDDSETIALTYARCHGAGAEAFLAPALHMLGCSQVAAVGNRAWPAVYHDRSFVNGNVECELFLDDYITEDDVTRVTRSYHDDNVCAVLFGRLVLLNNSHVCTRSSDIVGKSHNRTRHSSYRKLVSTVFNDATASRPDVIDPPKAETPSTVNRANPASNFTNIMCVELTTAASAVRWSERLAGHRGLSMVLTVEEGPSRQKPETTDAARPIIPKSENIFLTALSDFMFEDIHFPSIDKRETQQWIIDQFCNQADQNTLICNYISWYKCMVENNSHHFKPLQGCRAFQSFNEDHGSVLGFAHCEPAIFYYNCNNRKSWRIHDRTSTKNIICEGTWTAPGTNITYNIIVTPYYVPLADELTAHDNKIGIDLAKQLLGIRGVDMVSRNDLLVKYESVSLSDDVYGSILEKLVMINNWNDIEPFIEALELCIYHPVTLGTALTNNLVVVAKPVYWFNNQSPPREPSTIIPLLAWALSGHYDETWDNEEDGWWKAALALLPAELRPGYVAPDGNIGSVTAVGAMLNACKMAVTHAKTNPLHQTTPEELLKQATEHLTQSFTSELSASTTQPTIPTHLGPSQAVLWVHLVFCIMHGASLSDLASHPLLASPEERIDLLKKAGQSMHDDSKSCATGHLIHQKLWRNERITDAFSTQSQHYLHAYFVHLINQHPTLSHAVPSILVRHRLVHFDPDTDDEIFFYPKRQIKEIYRDDEEKKPETFLEFFGARFPALELVAWLIYTTTPSCLRTMRLANVAEATQDALISGVNVADVAAAYNTAKKAAEEARKAAAAKEKAMKDKSAEDAARVLCKLHFTDTEVLNLMYSLFKLAETSKEIVNEARKQLIFVDSKNVPWNDIVKLNNGLNNESASIETLYDNIRDAIGKFINASLLTLTHAVFDGGAKSLSDVLHEHNLDETTVDKFCRGEDGVRYELLRLALNVSRLSKDERVRIAHQYVEIKDSIFNQHKKQISDLRKVLSPSATGAPAPVETGLQSMQRLGKSILAISSVQKILTDPLKTAMEIAGPPGALAIARFAVKLGDYGDQSLQAQATPATTEAATSVSNDEIIAPHGDSEAN